MRAKSDGFELTFTHEVDAKTAGDPSYSMSAYTYIYQSKYGSRVVDKLTPKVIGAEVTGPKKVRVTVDKLTKGHVHELQAKGVRSLDGKPILHPIGYYTLNEIRRPRSTKVPKGGLKLPITTANNTASEQRECRCGHLRALRYALVDIVQLGQSQWQCFLRFCGQHIHRDEMLSQARMKWIIP